jgi:hypothetical protein
MRRLSSCLALSAILLPAFAVPALANGAQTPPDSRPMTAKNLPYKGGPVMHQPDFYPIFWLPDGYHYHPAANPNTDSDFENLQQQFLADLPGTPFYRAVATQYADHKGPITDTFTVENGIVDSSSFPLNRGSISNPLMDKDIRNEILKNIAQQQLDNQPGETEFVVYTPFDVQVCGKYDPQSTVNSTCTYRPGNKGRCGYHSWFSYQGAKYIYAVITTTNTFCHAWQRKITDDSAPNGDSFADIAVDVTSHELFESITDPYLNAYVAPGVVEVGDKCSEYIGPLADDGSDIVLSGDSYILQKEWSNADHGCIL